MIEQQIRPWDVLDQRVLELIAALPREDFVPAGYLSLAYADINIPLEHGQTMMAPKVEARMVQALELKPRDTVLEIGTGSGYVTALLGKSCKHVYSVDIYADFVHRAAHKLTGHGITNVTLENGDAANGWGAHQPYDAIAVTGSLPILPEQLRRQLKVGGRLFVVTGDERAAHHPSERGWLESAHLVRNGIAAAGQCAAAAAVRVLTPPGAALCTRSPRPNSKNILRWLSLRRCCSTCANRTNGPSAASRARA